MIDPPPCDIGNMQKAVDTAEIDESAVIGDVFDHTFENLALLKISQQFVALLGAGFFQNRAAGNDDVSAAAIHFQDLERLRGSHQRSDIADGAHIDLAAGQKGDSTGKVDGEPALDAAKDGAGNAFGFLEGDFKLRPRLFAAGAFTAENGLSDLIFHPFQIYVDDIANVDLGGLSWCTEFLQGHAAFGLKPNVDQYIVAVDGKNGPFDDRALGKLAIAEAFFEKCGEIFCWGCACSG